jgi:hypothetical protein
MTLASNNHEGTININCDYCGVTAAVGGEVQTSDRIREVLSRVGWKYKNGVDACTNHADRIRF